MRVPSHRSRRGPLLLAALVFVCLYGAEPTGGLAAPIAGRADAIDVDGGPGTPRSSRLAADDHPVRVAINGATAGQPLVLSPPRLVFQEKPNTLVRIPITLQNRGDEPTSVSLAPATLTAATDPATFARLGSATSSADRDWIDLPFTTLGIGRREQVTFPVYVRIPAGAEPGLHALALVVTRSVAEPAPTTDNSTRVSLRLSLASQILVTLPGPARVDGRVTHPNGPRLVWHGQRPTFRALLENRGTVLLDARPVWHSGSFATVASTSVRADRSLVLPRGKRAVSVRWNDTPWFGVYHPELSLECSSGCAEGTPATRVSYPTVLVLPPWWVLALLGIALLIPLVTWIRSRAGQDEDEAAN